MSNTFIKFFFRNFEVILKQIKWPYTMNESMDAKLENSKQKFHRLASLLMKIKLPYPFEKNY